MHPSHKNTSSKLRLGEVGEVMPGWKKLPIGQCPFTSVALYKCRIIKFCDVGLFNVLHIC